MPVRTLSHASMLASSSARSVLALSATFLVCMALSSCGATSESTTAGARSSTDIGLKLDTSRAGKDPGALYSATRLTTIDQRLRAAAAQATRITYTSTSGVTGELTEVTAAVFVPKGTPPAGGWPIVAFAHSTTGITQDCAPSQSATLLGASPAITGLVGAGYLVVAPDYQGLGVDGSHHPYLDSTTAGYNVIDSVRAARQLVRQASGRWAVFGHSQGGQAAWAANERAVTYGRGLSLVGSVSIAAPTDMVGYASGAEAGNLTPEQMATLQLILAALKAAHPDLDLDDYRRGVVQDDWNLLSSCKEVDAAARMDAIRRITADDLRPASPAAVDTLRGYLSAMGLPKTRAAAPMLVAYGGRDTHQLADWTEIALGKACELGDVIDIQFGPDRGHNDIDASAAARWIGDRFSGVPAPNGCPTFRPRS